MKYVHAIFNNLESGPNKAVSNKFDYPAQSYTFVEIDHEIISTVILLLPLIQDGFRI